MLKMPSDIFPSEYCGQVKDIVGDIRKNVPVSVFGFTAGERLHTTSCLDGFFVYIATDYLSAKAALTTLNQLCGGGVYLLPAKTDVLTYSTAKSNIIEIERQKALFACVSGKARGFVTTVDAFCQIMPPSTKWIENIIDLCVGGQYGLQELTSALVRAGYKRESMVESPGQWSLRGDILDVFPSQCAKPYRVEFFGDNVESIKIFDIESQTTVQAEETLSICPIVNVFLTDDEIEKVKNRIRREIPKNLQPEAIARYQRIIDEVSFKLDNNVLDLSLDYLLSCTDYVNLDDYLPKNATLVYEDCKGLLDSLHNSIKEHKNRYSQLLMSGEALQSNIKQMCDFEEFRAKTARFRQLAFHRITSGNNFFEPKMLYNAQVSPITRYTQNLQELADDIKIWLTRGYRIAICGGTRAACENLQGTLSDCGCLLEIKDSPDEAFYKKSNAILIPFELEKGFTYHDSKLIVVGTYDVLPKRASAVARRSGKAIFVQPNVGDYVVHHIHGIGICQGITKITSSMGTKDYVIIEYKNSDKLYVPIDQMDMLSKFGGGDPKLSKMGGEEFSRIKAKIARGVKAMAIDLLELYSERESSTGIQYNIDETFIKEFIDSFEFESTEDQLTAFEDIKRDLKSGKIMDRLLVGDVGYGKTEVALRTAFAVIAEGKQAAFLAPTTILSEQHFITSIKRFDKFGIRVGVLNRFCSQAEQTKTIEKLKNKEIDIVCGTHRLLSKDVEFNDLGLLILDEEQRFGVSDKEKIKALKATVNVLTMTATPIPRTLHMSMSGIRDISTLENPPADRLPVQTFVTEYTESLLKDAIEREITRGGKVFVVYNRVESIHTFAAGVQRIMPDLKIIVGHGQMNETELENNIKSFYDGDADCLISTTIIENGIDMASANTIIVVDADKLGLSQLYQLRGRVGRSNRIAYAYFTYNAGKELSETALKRLNTLMDFTEFGSGFKIAMRDLEIRGAGNVLGREQHGHMEKVGYDMYCKILAEEIASLRGKKPADLELECKVDIDIDAYIPNSFISDDDGRMRLYSRIAGLRSVNEREKLLRELSDIYGGIPKTVENLVNVGLYKGLGVKTGAMQLRITKTSAQITFRTMYENVAALLEKYPYAVLKMQTKPIIDFDISRNSKQSIYEQAFIFLHELSNMLKVKEVVSKVI